MTHVSPLRPSTIRVVAALFACIFLFSDFPFVQARPAQPDVSASPNSRYVNFTAGQQAAQVRVYREKRHAPWRNMTWSRRLERLVELGKRAVRAKILRATAISEPGTAPFEGNLTVINGPEGQGILLQRQQDCSLKLLIGSYTVSLTSPTIEVLSETPNHDRTLHNLAGLTTRPGTFATGCEEATAGIGSRRASYLGRSPQNLYLFAAAGYSATANSNALYSGMVDTGTKTVQSFSSDAAIPGIGGVAAGDLNGDGLADVIGIDYGSASIGVWLSQADGSLQGPTSYPLPSAGDRTSAAVAMDVDGDGKLDVLVATRDNVSKQEYVSVLSGQGDGTLGTPASMMVPTPNGSGPIGSATQIVNLVAVDLRGSGHPDLIASNGLVLLNHDGDGTFNVGDFAFPPRVSASPLFGPNLAAGDFNNDGKPDLAVNDGTAISLYIGDGAGRFVAGRAYASITDVGYLTASDLDGDGNVDLYVGLANGGDFGGDQYLVNQAYALMGNGDGSFHGAPATPFMYTGTNLGDLNGDGKTDAIGVNPDLSFTSYLGDGTGNFAAHSTLDISPLNLFGRDYNPQDIDSLAIADVNGDSHADLLFIVKGLYVRPPVGFDTPGIVIALGDGQGGFAAPGFFGSPHFVPTPDGDSGTDLTNLRIVDADGDGKADLLFSYSALDGTTGINYAGVAVQLGIGDGTFGDAQTLVFYQDAATTNQTFKVAATADLNKDARQDLLIMVRTTTFNSNVGQQEYELQAALGNGDGTFAAPVAVAMNDVLPGDGFSGTQYMPLAVADMNGDANPDLVTLGASSTGSLQVAVALGNGDGSFKAAGKTTYSAAYLGQSLGVGDLNGDSKPDVFVGSFAGPPESAVTLGNGDGTLQPVTGSSFGTVGNQLVYLITGGATTAADFNGDGKVDVLTGRTLLFTHEAMSTPPDFIPSATSLAGTAAAGGSVETTITFTPSSGFQGDISLSCSGLPTAATCSFNPGSVTVGAGPVNTTLTIATTARSAALRRVPGGTPWDPLAPGGVMLAGGLALILIRRRRERRRSMPVGGSLRTGTWWIVLTLVGVALLQSCGGGGSSSGGGSTTPPPPPPPPTGTPAGTYTITINATSGATTHTLDYVLTVS